MNNQSKSFIRKSRVASSSIKTTKVDFELIDGQVKLSELTPTSAINDNDLIPITSYESGDPVSSDIPASDVKEYILATISGRVPLIVANQDARLALTTNEVEDDQLIVQDSDHTVWVAINPSGASSVTWQQVGDDSGSFDPFDAKVTTAAQWNNAILTSKKVIFIGGFPPFSSLRPYCENGCIRAIIAVSAAVGVVIEPVDDALGIAGDEHVAIPRVGADGGRRGDIREALEGHGVGAVVTQHPDVGADVVGKNVSAVELGEARAAIDDAADDGAAWRLPPPWGIS